MTHSTDPAPGTGEPRDDADRSAKNSHRKAAPVASESHTKETPAKSKGGRGVHRRSVLGGMAGAAAAFAAGGAPFSLLGSGGTSQASAATVDLTIPDLLEGTTSDGVTTFTLEAKTGTHEVLSGVTSDTMGYNQDFLGPTMKWVD